MNSETALLECERQLQVKLVALETNMHQLGKELDKAELLSNEYLVTERAIKQTSDLLNIVAQLQYETKKLLAILENLSQK